MSERETLEALEKAATPGPWEFDLNTNMPGEDEALTCALRNAAPRLLAIWKAAEKACAEYFDGRWPQDEKTAMDALRAALAEAVTAALTADNAADQGSVDAANAAITAVTDRVKAASAALAAAIAA